MPEMPEMPDQPDFQPPPRPPTVTISTFSKMVILFLFLSALTFTLGAIFRNRLAASEDWIAYFFLALTFLAFLRAMIQPRTVTLLISMALSLGMMIFSMVIFLHLQS